MLNWKSKACAYCMSCILNAIICNTYSQKKCHNETWTFSIWACQTLFCVRWARFFPSQAFTLLSMEPTKKKWNQKGKKKKKTNIEEQCKVGKKHFLEDEVHENHRAVWEIYYVCITFISHSISSSGYSSNNSARCAGDCVCFCCQTFDENPGLHGMVWIGLVSAWNVI